MPIIEMIKNFNYAIRQLLTAALVEIVWYLMGI